MFFMCGSAIMSGTPFVFLLYFLLLFLALLFRYLILFLFKAPPIGNCGDMVYLPFIFGDHKEFISTFIFLFTLGYIFGPYFNWKSATESSVFMFVFLIVYAVYDYTMRAFTGCMSSASVLNRYLTVVGNIILGGGLGSLAQFGIVKLGIPKYLYYSSTVNRPTKKVFRCGKIKN